MNTNRPSLTLSIAAAILCLATAGPASAQTQAEMQEKMAVVKASIATVEAEIEDARLELQKTQLDLEKMQAALMAQMQEGQNRVAGLQKRLAELQRKRELMIAQALTAEADSYARITEELDALLQPPPLPTYRIGAMLDPGNASEVGVLVTGTQPGSPAEQAGIRSGDRIQSVNKIRVNDYRALQSLIQGAGEQQVMLIVRRGGEGEGAAEAIVVNVTPQKVEPKPQATEGAAYDVTRFWDVDRGVNKPISVVKRDHYYQVVPTEKRDFYLQMAPTEKVEQDAKLRQIDERLQRLEELVKKLADSAGEKK